MTCRGKQLTVCAILFMVAGFLSPARGQYDRGNDPGTIQGDFSNSPYITTQPARKSYVDNPGVGMVNTLQRDNTPIYPSTTAKSSSGALPDSFLAASPKPPLPPPDPNGDPVSGGTTHILTSDNMMLSPDGLPVSGAEYPSHGYARSPVVTESPFGFNESWTWQVLPGSILYKSYLAGNHESRLGVQMVHINDQGNFWDVTLGGRAGILRYGNSDPYEPAGYQLDIEGAAFPRLNLDHDRDLDSVDFRAGIPLTMRVGQWQTKFGYYHLSSHLGDEFLVRNNTLDRINYVRESLMLGVGLFLNSNFRLYSEVDYAFYTDGGAKPWEFQFGAEFSPVDCDRFRGSPFMAVNAHLHQEVDFGGSVTAQIGWQWRGRTGHLLRTGFQYFNGMSEQAQFFRRFEQQYGWGVWYDF